jgi:hypothetical protein
MDMHTKFVINAPAQDAWQVLGRDFATIGQWASSIPSSHLEGELSVGAVRTCQSEGFGPFPGGDFKEELIQFDQDAMAFTYKGTEGMPWFMLSARNAWSVEPLGPEKCCVHSRASIVLVWWMRPLGPLLLAMMRGGMKDFGDDLTHQIEQGKPHPRKLAVLGVQGAS